MILLQSRNISAQRVMLLEKGQARMAKVIENWKLVPADDPMFKQPARIVAINRFRLSTKDTGSATAGAPKTPELYNGKLFQELPEAERARISRAQFLKDHPTVTPEELDEMSSAFGA